MPEQRIYRGFLRPADLRSSAIMNAVLGVVFLLIGSAASLVLLYELFVDSIAFLDWTSGWHRLFLLGLLIGPWELLVSFRRARRVKSLARTEAAGIPAWARVTRIRQAAEGTVKRQMYTFRLQVRADDGSVFESTAFDYLPISDGRIHAWAEVYQLWFPVRFDPQDRSHAKILWNDPRIAWTSAAPPG